MVKLFFTKIVFDPLNDEWVFSSRMSESVKVQQKGMCMSRLQRIFLLHNIMDKQQKSKPIEGISKNLFLLLLNVYSVLQKHLGGKMAATGHEGAVKKNLF